MRTLFYDVSSFFGIFVYYTQAIKSQEAKLIFDMKWLLLTIFFQANAIFWFSSKCSLSLFYTDAHFLLLGVTRIIFLVWTFKSLMKLPYQLIINLNEAVYLYSVLLYYFLPTFNLLCGAVKVYKSMQLKYTHIFIALFCHHTVIAFVGAHSTFTACFEMLRQTIFTNKLHLIVLCFTHIIALEICEYVYLNVYAICKSSISASILKYTHIHTVCVMYNLNNNFQLK